MRKVINPVLATFAAIIAIPLLGAAAILGGGGASCFAGTTISTTVPTAVARSGAPIPALDSWDTEQLTNVATIITVGASKAVPPWGWVVAVATAIQESGLRNLPSVDRDSIGLFQQRPSQGWGTPAQLADPAYQAGTFFDKLLTIKGWQQMPLTQAAQAVQRSAYPDAYAKHTTEAIRLVSHVGSSGSWAMAINLEHCPSNCPTILSNSGGPTPGTPVATLQATAHGDGGCTAGLAALARAETWLTAWNGGPVPYLSSANPATWFQGYRRDCSGYASMALGLPGPGLNSAGLAARGTPIAKIDLQAGDLLINPAPDLAGHVVIFDYWTDASMNRYLGYEQAGDGGTHHRTIPYPYFGGYQMKPYRL
jgi:hypothetical protein